MNMVLFYLTGQRLCCISLNKQYIQNQIKLAHANCKFNPWSQSELYKIPIIYCITSAQLTMNIQVHRVHSKQLPLLPLQMNNHLWCLLISLVAGCQFNSILQTSDKNCKNKFEKHLFPHQKISEYRSRAILFVNAQYSTQKQYLLVKVQGQLTVSPTSSHL